MENRPPRSRRVGSAKSPRPDGADSQSSTPIPEDLPAAEFQSLGSTRNIESGDNELSGHTRSAEDTDSQPEVKPTEKEVNTLGDFELLKKLGEGAMGAVYKAHQISFDRDVALKVLFPHVANNPKLVERLHREAHAMFALDHPNIIESYAVDEAQGYHYVAMEFVDGDSVQKWLGRLGRFSVGDAARIILDCARALEYAHGQGVIHRDIKPDNVLIDRRGKVKVADLGMVKTLDEDMALTQTGHAVGTPWYMPLEQAKNAKDTDGRCDIYALGCMFYCLLTGNPPFTGRTLVEVIQAKEIGTFPPARSVNPEVSERLDLLIAKMTAKLPKNRYQTCAEVIKDLEALGLASTTPGFLSGNSTKPTATVKAPKPAGSSAAESDEWYVRFTREGEISARALTTKQLKKMLEEGTIGPTAKVSRQPTDGFRALATYKEFQATAMVKQTKRAADKESVKYRNIYKKIEEKERQRDRDEKKHDASGPSYYSGLLSQMLVAGLGIAGAALVIYMLIRLFS